MFVFACRYALGVCGACISQMRVSNPLELELQVIVSFYVGPGN